MTPAEESFAIHKAPHIAACIVENLKRARRETYVTPDRGRGYAVVVGAGHTLPGAEMLGSGPTIAVNSAIGACLSRGHVPRFVVCRESLDMSHQIRQLPKGRTTVILDIGVHPETWRAAEEVASEVRWFVPATVQTFALAAHLGVEPLYAGNSNVTAAVALAEYMGADDIDLLGCSRAFAADGRAYADGTGWESVRLDHVETMSTPTEVFMVGHIVGTEAKERVHAASGQRPPLKVEKVVPVKAVDGSTRYALETLETDRRWLELFAARRPHLALVQHHPDVAIAGWCHAPRVADPVTAAPDLLADARRQAELVPRVVDTLLDGGRVLEVPGILGGSDLVDFGAVGRRVQITRAIGRDPMRAIPAAMRAWGETAEALAAKVAG